MIVHFPNSKQGQEELAKRVATAHAQMIHSHISGLECPTEQKVALLDAIQKNIRAKNRERERGLIPQSPVLRPFPLQGSRRRR